jgi:hypothetical protein
LLLWFAGCGGPSASPPIKLPPPPIKLQVEVVGAGAVTGAGLPSCTASCATTLDAQATATLHAVPAQRYAFAGWSGDCTGEGDCTVQATRDLRVAAKFVLVEVPRTLTVSVAGAGRGTVTSVPAGISCPGVCTAQFPLGSDVTLSAAPASGSLFVAWSGSCSGAPSCKTTLAGDSAVAATFALAPRVLTVSLQGAGSVRSVPAGIACPGACSNAFAPGTSVRLTAAPAAGNIFTGWSGACTGAAACPLTLASDAAVTAAFDAPPPPRVSGDWTFYGRAQGGPAHVLGISADAGGNLWVAGGDEGLFVLRVGSNAFQRFTMDDGLRPYGFMPDGSAPPGDKFLKVISVAGGPPDTAFVGYEGKPPGPGQLGCEDNWDGPSPDPSIYKSGDADKVTLAGAGIAVVHYDIFSGPGVVGNELRGREKLCNILRIAYDPGQDAVWFGANHGFAMGRASFQGNATCNGQLACAGALEHVHPGVNAWNDAQTSLVLLTGEYHGVAVDPLTHDVWFGGANRTTRFRYASTGRDYFAAQALTEDAPYKANRIDVWPDKVQEPDYPRPSDRVDDLVSGIASLSDGSAWVASYANGLAHVDNSGAVLGYVGAPRLISRNVFAIAADPSDQSIWVGYWYDGGLSRLSGGNIATYGAADLGPLSLSPVTDIQVQGTGSARRVLVAFQDGGVGVYAGP